ncbi:MAG: 2OG-Fe(II) oxygenase [Candidatus Obscuribacterales bacterium]|nr:2OG-Fe(II) oxygenase [Candidatus Obscuribacterales bacterium]
MVSFANGWNAILKSSVRYPDLHEEFLEPCHEAGQTRPTPLILQIWWG